MIITYPYEIEINSKEEAHRFITHLCEDCPRYFANWDCCGATVAKCQKSIKNVREVFKMSYEKLAEEKMMIILPVPLDSKVFEIRKGYSYGEVGDKPEPWYYVAEKTFTIDDYEWFGDTIFATQEEALERVKVLKK